LKSIKTLITAVSFKYFFKNRIINIINNAQDRSGAILMTPDAPWEQKPAKNDAKDSSRPPDLEEIDAKHL
jgi:hypothetical protein